MMTEEIYGIIAIIIMMWENVVCITNTVVGEMIIFVAVGSILMSIPLLCIWTTTIT